MEEALVKGEVVFMANEETTEVAEVSKGALDLPAFAITAQGTAILRGEAAAPTAMGTDQLDAARRQSLAEALRVVSAVTDESGRTIAGTTRARTRHLHCPQGFFRRG